MDIIAAHRQGLIEQLEEEVTALAGRSHDHGQRAVVLHHIFDHSGRQHHWALCEARQELRIAAGISALRRKLDRLGWMIGKRVEAREALDKLAAALGQAAMARTAAAYRAYRLSATTSLRTEAEAQLPPDLFDALDECHRARRLGEARPADARQLLDAATERASAAVVDSSALDAAWAAIDATSIGRSARRWLDNRAMARLRARDQRRGWERLERELRNDPALPASFRANPAQHFYALQHILQERRRQQWREACDREPDAFELAA